MFLPYKDDPPTDPGRPWMNWALIAVNVFLFLRFATQPGYDAIVQRHGFTPAYFATDDLFTCMFLHGSFMHLAGNMWFLHLYGDNVELRLGPVKYLVCYLLSGLAGTFGHYFFFQTSTIPSIGASGAIFGVMGMYIFLFPSNRIHVLVWILFYVNRLLLPAVWVIGGFAALELIYSHVQTLKGVEGGVGHLAHAGGFLGGLLLAALLFAVRLVRNDQRNLYYKLTGRALPPEFATETGAGGVPGTGAGPGTGTGAGAPQGPGALEQIQLLLYTDKREEARKLWRRHAFDHHDAVLPPRDQLELALELDKHNERGAARDAYERLIEFHPDAQPFTAEAHLALAGMLLAEWQRTGDRTDLPSAIALLRTAVATHPTPKRRALAEQWLAEVEAHA